MSASQRLIDLVPSAKKSSIYSHISSNIILKIVDILFILFIYINIISPGPLPVVFTVKKILFGILLLVSLLYNVLRIQKYSISNMNYLFFVFSSTLTMALISLFKGNEMNNILKYVFPIMFFLFIPILESLYKNYSIERYLQHILYGGLVLSFIVLSVVFISEILNFREITLFFPTEGENRTNISISYPLDSIRVQVQTGVFLAASLCIALYFSGIYRSKYYYIIIPCILSAVYFTKTIGIWGACVFVIIAYLIKKKNYLINTIVVLIFLFIVFFIQSSVITDLRQQEEKDASFRNKKQQIYSGLELFFEKPIFGQGIGYIFRGVDERSDYNESVIENTPILLLSTGGLYGVTIYAFIYLYPVMLFFLKKRKSIIPKILIISHMSILIAGFSNPYILAGGMGLFFPVLYLSFKMHKQSRSNESGEPRPVGLIPSSVS